MLEDDLQHFEQRARQEREAARSEASPAAESAHRLLAIEYETQLRNCARGWSFVPRRNYV